MTILNNLVSISFFSKSTKSSSCFTLSLPMCSNNIMQSNIEFSASVPNNDLIERKMPIFKRFPRG
ncbi:hypothetical protein PPL_05002 [Heterostelium album PN500]|uniref:Uncharacterized protein n=1 Tax=Heterostelium pallidum (strain ATCC 26659 / Pp 5 / PN500) TaxID=670386 RepID=D3B958_HETP5|nr:hypothetical protein PPL_05002 [Heterostelium album PN500]EFA82097.1 hypothetical protein PPL_05002 [Heterostelium album PN500]|eukprot:XP_020434214.1 hypothetical protein PPL_05002 [Heterostelium album PN500]